MCVYVSVRVCVYVIDLAVCSVYSEWCVYREQKLQKINFCKLQQCGMWDRKGVR